MRPTNRRAILGLFLVLIGAIILLDNLRYIQLPYYLFSWMTLLMAIGIFNIISGNRTAGIILLLIGGVFFLQDLDLYYFDLKDYWPLILIIIGITFIFRHRFKTIDRHSSDDDFFDDLNIFGGSEKKFVSQNLKGGKITNIFGGSTIDLRESKLNQGAFIEVFTMFGGCTVLVPV